MKKILFCSHGRLCEGMLDTLKVFSLYDENTMQAIPFYIDDEHSLAENKLEAFISEIKPEDTVLVFTDIAFGSVNQIVMAKMQEFKNVHILTGMNLMLVLELISMEEISEEVIRDKVESAKESIIYTREMIQFSSEEDE